VHDFEQHSYGAWLGQEQVAYLSYRLVGRRVALWSTAVLPAYRKRRGHRTHREGTGRHTCIRAHGHNHLPVVREVINRYLQYEDLVDKEHPGVRSPVNR
jgi:hypothetical protein